jgi:anaerobic magnesium-protoporphyrin IX monomethyl ester cyclase
MKILFVYSLDDIQSVEKPLRSWSSIQFGISYISSTLKAHGHQTKLVVLGDSHWKKSQPIYRSAVEGFSPDLVCFTATYSQYAFIERIASFTKTQWPGIYLLIGGVHATLNPDEVIQGPFDALCVGEGEYPTLKLCSQLVKEQAPHGIPNLWIKTQDGEIERNQTRDFLPHLDQLPFPDREIWESWMKPQLDAEFAVLLGRGCPYDCTYCSNHALRKVAGGDYVRFRSPENIIQEISLLYQSYQPKSIYLEVETIAVNKSWTVELCDQLAALNTTLDRQLSYGCNFRISPNSVDEDLFKAFKRANIARLNIGLESGSEKIRREVMKRFYSNQDFLNVAAIARKYGLQIYVYNMIGLPGESLNDHMETVLLNRQCQPDQHYTSIFFPYPGTRLYDMCLEQGLLKGPLDAQMERRKAIIELPDVTKRQIQRAYTWFDYRVYRGHKPLGVILIKVMSAWIRSNPVTNYVFRQLVQLPVLRQIRARLARS